MKIAQIFWTLVIAHYFCDSILAQNALDPFTYGQMPFGKSPEQVIILAEAGDYHHPTTTVDNPPFSFMFGISKIPDYMEAGVFVTQLGKTVWHPRLTRIEVFEKKRSSEVVKTVFYWDGVNQWRLVAVEKKSQTIAERSDLSGQLRKELSDKIRLGSEPDTFVTRLSDYGLGRNFPNRQDAEVTFWKDKSLFTCLLVTTDDIELVGIAPRAYFCFYYFSTPDWERYVNVCKAIELQKNAEENLKKQKALDGIGRGF